MGIPLVRKPVAKEYIDAASAPITLSTWLEVITLTSEPASGVEIFNGTGRLLRIALGAIGAEVEMPYFIPPGGSADNVALYDFPKNVRVSLKAVDVQADVGLVIFNFFG